MSTNQFGYPDEYNPFIQTDNPYADEEELMMYYKSSSSSSTLNNKKATDDDIDYDNNNNNNNNGSSSKLKGYHLSVSDSLINIGPIGDSSLAESLDPVSANHAQVF